MEKTFIEKLDFIYELPCPVCERHWTYELVDFRKENWRHVRRCGHSEMHKQINERHYLMFGNKLYSDETQDTFKNI
jgi:hypothetical protein